MSLYDAYLNLLASVLTGELTEDPPFDPWHGVVKSADGAEVSIDEALRTEKPFTVGSGAYDATVRQEGFDWPSSAFTMIGRKRLENIRQLVQRVHGFGVHGDFIEAGAWRGGACIFMRAVLEALGSARRVFVADSFEGLPAPDGRYAQDAGDPHYLLRNALAVSQTEVEKNFRRFGLFDEEVVFVPGLFKDTLHKLSAEFALVRIDGDMYSSTMDALLGLYPKLAKGGFVIVDDYHSVRSCGVAVDAFREKFEINDPMVSIDNSGIYWQKRGT